jgi:hypothetical protein
MTASGDSTRDTRNVFFRRLVWILCFYSVLVFATAGCILLTDFLVPNRFLAHSKSAIEFLSYFAAKLALLGFLSIAPIIAAWVSVLSLNSIVDQS